MLYVDLLIFFILIVISYKKHLSIGFIAITGLLMYSLILNKPISKPSLDLALIILSVITATSSLSASGGINYISILVEKILIKHKSFIEIIAPIFTFITTILCGTPYIVLSIIPIIVKICIEENIKPVYTITGCIIAANHGYLCSPIGAPFIVISHHINLNTYQILIKLISSCFIGLLCTIIYNFIRQKMDNSKIGTDIIEKSNEYKLENYNEKNAKKAMTIFILGLITIFLVGLIDNFKPNLIKNTVIKKSEMAILIPLFMFSISCLINYLCNLNIKNILEQKIMEYGFKSIVTIIGISWLSNTLIENNRIGLQNVVKETFSSGNLILLGLILFFGSVFMASQTAALLIFIPLYLKLGISNTSILKIIPLVDGLFFIPLTAIFSFAIEYDKTNSTKSGDYIFNHSLMIPGFIATSISTLIMYNIIQ